MIDEPKIVNGKTVSKPLPNLHIEHYLSMLDKIIPLIAVVLAIGLIAAVVCYIVVHTVVKVLNWRHLSKLKLAFLELTPPANISRSTQANEKLVSILHGLGSTGALVDKLLRRKEVWDAAIVGTHAGGIRFVFAVNEQEADNFKQVIRGHMPEIQVRDIPDYLPNNLTADNSRVLEFKQTGHWFFSLARHDRLENYDPMAHMTSAMTQLKDNELMVMQLVASPLSLDYASGIMHKLLNNEDLLTHLNQKHSSLLKSFFFVLNKLLFGITGLITEVFHGSSSSSPNYAQSDAHNRQQVAQRLKPARQLSVFEQQLVASVDHKVQQPLFRVSVRALIVTDNKREMAKRTGAVKASLAAFTVPKYQSLVVRFGSKQEIVNRYRLYLFTHRMPALLRRHDCILAASEISDLYHFPHPETTETENIVKSLSRTLPAPLSLKQGTHFDVVLGSNMHHGAETDIGLTIPERERHIYIIGGTGNGKTTMLQFAIVQDMHSGKGLAVIDPHGDMANMLLQHVPENRMRDVIYFNPDDLFYPIGLNLLEIKEGLSGTELMREKDLITESVISVFRKIFSDDDSGGHRIEYVLRNTVQTALTIEDATLFTIFDLLNDQDYRKKIVKTLKSKDLRNFWKNELGKAGEFQRVKMSAGITAKIGRFLFSASAKQILEQPRSTIDFDDVINSGKILICNFSKGLLGEDTSELFGIMVLAKLQLATLRRARLEQGERLPFYLYVDEFQNFATASFVQMLSEARKYKLYLTMAEQSTSQQSDQQMVNVILANVGTVICFKTGNPQDERLLLPLFSPYLNEGEINNLSAFNFYAKLSAMKAQEPLSGQTVLITDEGSHDIAEQVIELSRQHYAKAISEEVKEIKPSSTQDEENEDDFDLGDALIDDA
jgi:hypothetical protein